jgi:uncharacterized protein (DUF4213/DUF364 family)
MNIWVVIVKFKFNIYILDHSAPIKKREANPEAKTRDLLTRVDGGILERLL